MSTKITCDMKKEILIYNESVKLEEQEKESTEF